MGRPLDRFFDSRPAKSRKRKRRLPVAAAVPRLRILLIVVAVIFSVAAGRAVQVQAIDGGSLALKAAEQSLYTVPLAAMRGSITDRNGEVLAFTDDTVTVSVSPRMIATNGRMSADMTSKDKATAAGAPPRLAALLAQYLGGSPQDYLRALTVEGSNYQVVKTGVAAATFRALSQAVNDAGLVGVYSESAPSRRYPNVTLASNVLGYVNSQGVGAAGLEYVLDKTLAGTPGKEVYQRAANGGRIPMGTYTVVPAVDGASYALTLDAGMQSQAEQAVADQVRRTGAKWGAALVMNVKTGEILTLAVSPGFDPSRYGKADPATLGNRAVTDAYTPGSVQKVLTFAALIDQGLVDPGEVVTIPGSIKSGDGDVGDAWNHGKIKLYARGIIAKSSNVGTVILARRASKQSLHDYMAAFGLGAKSRVGLPGEASGSLPGAEMPDYSRDGLAFGGSAVSVTMVQMASAVGAIANGGVYNPPQLLLRKTASDGTATDIRVGASRRVIKEDTAAQVLSMMEAMAQHSASHTFDVTGYRVGAKTGTSQKLDPKTGKRVGLVTSAISVAPVENPQLLVYVVVDNPQRGAFGATVAGPVVKSLMSIGLARYAVPPSATTPPPLPIEP